MMQKHAMEILNAYNFLKHEEKNKMFIPICRKFYDLSKNIRSLLGFSLFWRKTQIPCVHQTIDFLWYNMMVA